MDKKSFGSFVGKNRRKRTRYRATSIVQVRYGGDLNRVMAMGMERKGRIGNRTKRPCLWTGCGSS